MRELRLQGVATRLNYLSKDVDKERELEAPPGLRSQPPRGVGGASYERYNLAVSPSLMRNEKEEKNPVTKGSPESKMKGIRKYEYAIEIKVFNLLEIDADLFTYETPLGMVVNEFKGLRTTNDDDVVQADQGWFDNHEPMESNDDDIGDLGDYLIRNEGLYYVDEEEERSNEIR
ncbi:hypothetical protein Tco_0469352 [Tanacetum coccineum]